MLNFYYVHWRFLCFFLFFFFNHTATTEIYTLSLHDALPIQPGVRRRRARTLRHVGPAMTITEVSPLTKVTLSGSGAGQVGMGPPSGTKWALRLASSSVSSVASQPE